MLTIRYFRAGKKNQPFFKIVVTDKKNPPKGGVFAEELGFYNPITKEKRVNAERAKYWISVGAKPSDSVYNLFIKENILQGKKIPSHNVKPKTEEKPKEEKKEAAENKAEVKEEIKKE